MTLDTLKLYPWKRTIFKTVALIIVLMIISAVVNYSLLNTNLAMTQLENDDSYFLAWEIYNHVRSALSGVYALVGIVYLVGVGVDIHKFIKMKETEGDLN